MTTTSSFQKTASRILILGGALSAPIGLISLFYPPAVDESTWGYPFPPGILVYISIALVIVHLLKGYGFIGLTRLEGASRLTRWSLIVAVFGFVVLAICEGISATLGGMAIDSQAATRLNNGYGIGSMLVAIPSMVGGIGIIRRRLLDGFDRWSVFLSGAFMIFVMTPALIMGRDWPAFLALTVWSLFYIWIGRALGRRSTRAKS